MPALLDKNPEYQLGHAQMDQTHSEFINLVNRIAEAGKQEFASLFNQLVEHTKAHFEQENEWMEETAFPAMAEHQGEHRRVLSDLEQFQTRVNQGATTMARAWLKQTVPEWFKLHLANMDAALARHMQLSQPAANNGTSYYSEISVAPAQSLMEQHTPLILDARDTHSYKESHIEGAMQAHGGLVEHLIQNQSKQKYVLIYCYRGTSSKDLAEVFGRAGFEHTYSLIGGYTAWKKAQLQSA